MDEKTPRSQTPLTDFLNFKACRAKIPLSGTFELSPVCNFSCRMCYVRKTPAEVRAHDRPMVTMERWLEIARQAREKGMLYLLLTGGEPFLWPDFWALYEQLIRMGFLISINSNGSLIGDEAIRRLRQMPPTRINITLYGASDATYEALCRAKGVFSRVDHAIRGLKAAGITVKLNCSLTPQNAQDQEAIVAYAQANGLLLSINEYMLPPLRRDPAMLGRNVRFTPEEAAFYHMKSYRLQCGEEAYQKYLNNIVRGLALPPGLDESCEDPLDGKIRCRAGRASFWITWDGYLTPCGMMPEPKADLTGRSFSDAWQEIGQRCEPLVLSGACSKCPNRDMCHACAAMAQTETGSTSGIPQYLCRMTQEMRTLAKAELDGAPLKPLSYRKAIDL